MNCDYVKMEKEDSDAQRKANLARIRENQRRSRARRKDYLQELESKFQQCKQSGVEASAEIQTAARKVVEENKRLRLLLKQQGFSDAEIDGVSTGQPELWQSSSNAAKELEDMLRRRKTCPRCDTDAPTQAKCEHVETPVDDDHSMSSRRSTTPANAFQNGWQPQYSDPTYSAANIAPSPTALSQTTEIEQVPPYTTTTSSSHPVVDYGVHYDPGHGWQQSDYTNSSHYTPSLSTTGAGTPVYTATDVLHILRSDFGYGLSTDLR